MPDSGAGAGRRGGRIEPETPEARLRWLEAALAGIAHQLAAIAEELRAATLQPQPLDRYERRLVRKLRHQLAALDEDARLLRAQLAGLRARRGRET